MARNHKALRLALHYLIDQFLRFACVVCLDLFLTLCRKRDQRVARSLEVGRIECPGPKLSDLLYEPLSTLLSFSRKLGIDAGRVGLLGVTNQQYRNVAVLGRRLERTDRDQD